MDKDNGADAWSTKEILSLGRQVCLPLATELLRKKHFARVKALLAGGLDPRSEKASRSLGRSLWESLPEKQLELFVSEFEEFMIRGKLCSERSAAMCAVERGGGRWLTKVLEKGDEKSILGEGSLLGSKATALHVAAWMGDVDSTRRMLAAGAKNSGEDLSPAALAAVSNKEGSAECLQMIVEASGLGRAWTSSNAGAIREADERLTKGRMAQRMTLEGLCIMGGGDAERKLKLLDETGSKGFWRTGWDEMWPEEIEGTGAWAATISGRADLLEAYEHRRVPGEIADSSKDEWYASRCEDDAENDEYSGSLYEKREKEMTRLRMTSLEAWEATIYLTAALGAREPSSTRFWLDRGGDEGAALMAFKGVPRDEAHAVIEAARLSSEAKEGAARRRKI